MHHSNGHFVGYLVIGLTFFQPVKKTGDEVLVWLSVWSQMQIISIWSSWYHCHPIISCFITILTWLV